MKKKKLILMNLREGSRANRLQSLFEAAVATDDVFTLSVLTSLLFRRRNRHYLVFMTMEPVHPLYINCFSPVSTFSVYSIPFFPLFQSPPQPQNAVVFPAWAHCGIN